MKIVLSSFGSTGDVQPFLALGDELRRAGHTLLFVFPDYCRERIESLGFAFRPLGLGMELDGWRKIFAMQMTVADPVEQTRLYLEEIVPLLPGMARELREACADADALISPQFHLAARMAWDAAHGAAHRAGALFFVTLHLSPFGAQGQKSMREASAPIVNRCRQQEGLAPLNDPLGEDGASPDLALYPVSGHVFRRPSAWPAHHQVTGYFFFDEETWQPDPALVEFVEAGPPPVVVTFGSMPSADPDALTALLLAAVERVGCRAVIQHGGGDLGQGALPASIHATGFIPHRWLFPRAACVVHHGGAGTTAATFRAGVPTVVAPHLLDQPIWAEYARALGCAGGVLPYAKLTAERLATMIGRTLSTPRFREAAARLSTQIASEDGVGTARKMIEEARGRG